jgi:hypothetical protein
MNKGLQKHNVEKKMAEQGFDDFDAEGEIDSSLSFAENLDNLEEQKGVSLRKSGPDNSKQARQREISAQKRQAERRHRARSDQARKTDKAKEAEVVYDFPLSEDEWENWSENPNEVDVEGVDII